MEKPVPQHMDDGSQLIPEQHFLILPIHSIARYVFKREKEARKRDSNPKYLTQ